MRSEQKLGTGETYVRYLAEVRRTELSPEDREAVRELRKYIGRSSGRGLSDDEARIMLRLTDDWYIVDDEPPCYEHLAHGRVPAEEMARLNALEADEGRKRIAQAVE